MAKHFKGFDTLRAIAALIVVWSHLELLKKTNNIPNLHDSNFWLMPGGHIAVILFFVLSGFLITYLLVKEQENHGTISLKKFYLRRILRIWPLYYFIIFLSYIFVSSDQSITTITLCLSLFPNIAYSLGEGWAGSPQLWSIGVEEQFYLLWPFLLIKLHPKKVMYYLGAFFLIYSFLPSIIHWINIQTFQSGSLASFSSNFFYSNKFNCMAIGALLGYAVAKNYHWVSYFKSSFLGISTIVTSLFFTFSKIRFPYYNDEIFSIIYGIMIIGLAVNQKINIDTKITSFIGKISYGIYMYHWMIILLVLKLLPKTENLFWYNLGLYSLSFGICIFVSWLSFISIEKYFLNLKKKFDPN